MIKVFIIDDSMFIRNSIKKILKDQKGISILGEAANPVDAMDVFKTTGLPDVFILDIEMPKMDGLSFLKKLKDQKPIPTIIFSSVVGEGSNNAMEALSNGACDVIKKPEDMSTICKHDFEQEFISKVKAASKSKVISSKKIVARKTSIKCTKKTNKIVAIGASTGGVQTIEHIVKGLNKDHPPIVITQHMPVGFTNSFAKRLDKICENSMAKEAEDQEILCSGGIYIAPGNLHLEIQKVGIAEYKAVLKDYPKVSNHKPSVDVLFKSVSKEAGVNAIAFILTGMGKDGAMGIKKIKESGGKTYGQDEESSIVYGMPKVAFEMGGVESQHTPDEICDIINGVG